MSIIDQLGKFKSIICLNGQLPSRKLLLSLKLPIIAVDGASKKLYQLGVEPKLIIGDLDSDNRKLFPKVERIYTPDQNYSDFQKAMEYLGKRGLMPAIVTGIAGGYIDHILCNISIFSATNCIFITDNEIGFTRNYDFKLNLEKDSKISIIGCPSATVSSRGLKWELNNLRLNIFGFNSLSNRAVSDLIELDVLDGKVLVILYICQVIDNRLL